jgi:hypothetical protein
MTKKTKWIVAVVLFCLVAVGAAVAIVVGVATHDETVRMKVCWINEIGWPVERAKRPCNAVEVRWGRSPLKVSTGAWKGTLVEPWQLEETRRAIEDVNTQVGKRILTFVGGDLDSDVLVAWNVPREGDDPDEGVVFYQDPNGALLPGSAMVRIYSTGHQPLAYRVLLHGLGHVVGLGHDDDNPRSIMSPVQPELSLVEGPAWFTDVDVRELRENGP